MGAIPLFVSYAHEDEKWLDLLTRHLASLENDGLVEVWDDRDIRAASEKTWTAQLLPKLENAGVIVVILSPDFASSSYCQKVELPRAIARKESGDALVFFVLARAYAIERSVSRFQIMPSADQALHKARDKDAAMAHIVEQIRSALDDFQPAAPAARPRAELRMLPPYLPYLCDRSEQEDALHLLYDGSPARPLVFLLPGPHHECHEAFHERLAREFLPSLLGVAGTAAVDPSPIEWPAADPRTDWPNAFSVRIARALGTFGREPKAILRALPEGLTFLTTTIWAEEWGPPARDAVRAFLAYWNGWPDLPANRTVAVGVSIVTDGKDPSTAELEAAFPVAACPAVRFQVLPPLQPPRELHARNWLSHPRVKQWYNWEQYRDPLRERVSQIFTGQPAIPMRDLARFLLEALQAHT